VKHINIEQMNNRVRRADKPDAEGRHTATVNVMHSAANFKRFSGCEQCRHCAETSCPACYNVPGTSVFGGWDDRTETFATAVHHSPRGCGDASCELCAQYAAGWCQNCEQYTRPAKPPLPAWAPASCGAGKRHWFVARGQGAESDRVPVALRYHHGANGSLVRYASMAGAQRAADKLNAAEGAS
jgi:hypothetical protein